MLTALAGMSLITLVVGGLFFLFLYLIPSFIAWRRHHKNFLPILALNVLFGWALIGWVGALVWSLMSQEAKTPEVKA